MNRITSVFGLGESSDQNERYRKTMEDQTLLIDGFLGNPSIGLFVIMDGHGGSEASQKAKDIFSKTLTDEIYNEIFKYQDNIEDDQTYNNLDNINLPTQNIEQKSSYIDIDQYLQPPYAILQNTCRKVDEYLKQQNLLYVGSTLCCILITQKYIYTINIGDSRCVMSINGQAKRLTHDHKAIDAQESERIKKAGGGVVMGRVNGFISVSRALGDHCIKQLVISEPEINRYERDYDNQQFLIIACDGLWDVVTDQEAVQLVNNYYQQTQNCQTLARLLKDKALEKGTQDNVSIVLIMLKQNLL